MPQSIQVIAEAFLRAAERKVAPRNDRAVDHARLETLFVTAKFAADRMRRVDDDDRSAPRVGVDVHERIETDLQAPSSPRLPNGSGGERFAAIDVAAGKHPFAVARLDRAPHQYQPAVFRFDDRADRDFRIDIEHESARRADWPDRLR